MKCKFLQSRIIVIFLVSTFIINIFGEKNEKLYIKQPYNVRQPHILYVTTQDNKMNIVGWDSQNETSFSYYNVYRDSSNDSMLNSKPNWVKIGIVAENNDFNHFVDNSSLPYKREYKYKISAVDRCSNEFFCPIPSNSIFLRLETIENRDVLRWNKYNNAKGYNIFKGNLKTNDVKLLASVSDVDSLYELDSSTSDDNIYYKVEAFTDSVNYSWNKMPIKITSNYVSRLPKNIKEILNPSTVIFFRKNDHSIRIIFPYFNIDTFDLILFDMMGKKHFSEKVKGEYIEIPIPKMETGLYLLYFESRKYKLSKKIIL